MNKIFLSLIVIVSIAMSVAANKPETFKLRTGQQRSAAKGELKIKFISVVEDSRCPVGVNCIWAGNARIKVKATDSNGRSKEMVMNTGEGPQGDQFAGHAVRLTSLTPEPTAKGQPAASKYTATFSVERLYR